MTPERYMRVRTMPGGDVRLDLNDGEHPVTVELGWRLALGLAMRVMPAATACARAEGLTLVEFDALCTAVGDQIEAEVTASRRKRA